MNKQDESFLETGYWIAGEINRFVRRQYDGKIEIGCQIIGQGDIKLQEKITVGNGYIWLDWMYSLDQTSSLVCMNSSALDFTYCLLFYAICCRGNRALWIGVLRLGVCDCRRGLSGYGDGSCRHRTCRRLLKLLESWSLCELGEGPRRHLILHHVL